MDHNLLALLFGFITTTNVPDSPNDKLTPGAVSATAFEEVCGNGGWDKTHPRPRVLWSLHATIFRTYGLDPHIKAEQDHRVPRCLSGTDTKENLWPQNCVQWEGYRCISGPAYEKDLREAYICRAVCRNKTMSVAQGQAYFLGDWKTIPYHQSR